LCEFEEIEISRLLSGFRPRIPWKIKMLGNLYSGTKIEANSGGIPF
jgi:hypothetical protein